MVITSKPVNVKQFIIRISVRELYVQYLKSMAAHIEAEAYSVTSNEVIVNINKVKIALSANDNGASIRQLFKDAFTADLLGPEIMEEISNVVNNLNVIDLTVTDDDGKDICVVRNNEIDY